MASRKSKVTDGDLRVVVHRPGVTLIWRVLLVCVCLAIWATGFMMGGWDERRAPTKLLYQEREHLLAKIVEYRKRIGDLEIQVAQKDVELTISRASSGKVRDDYRKLYEQLDEYRAQVAHYKRVLKPNTGDQGIVLGLLELTPAFSDKTGDQVRFSLDFFQTIDRRKLTGNVEIILIARQNGQEKKLKFSDLSQDPLQLKLGFRHYQTLGGVITVPKGVEPMEVSVDAQITGGKSANVSKVFAWTLKELSDDLGQGTAIQ